MASHLVVLDEASGRTEPKEWLGERGARGNVDVNSIRRFGNDKPYSGLPAIAVTLVDHEKRFDGKLGTPCNHLSIPSPEALDELESGRNTN